MPLRRFSRDILGSVAIEFALLGPLFILLIVGFVYFASLALTTLRLNTAVAQTALMLGQNETAGQTESELRDMICAFAALSDCGTRLNIKIEPMTGFSNPGFTRDAEGALTMKILSARYTTGGEANALSRFVFGSGEGPDEIRASALFVARDG